MKKILSVEIEHIIDESPDTSWLGEYSSQPKGDVYIDRQERGDMGRNEYRYFNMSFNYEGESPEDQFKYMEQDYERMEALNRGDWWFIGVIAKAEVVLREASQTIRSAGLWGVESDAGSEHIGEVEDVELNQLKQELLAIGFSEKEIDEAFENVKEAV